MCGLCKERRGTLEHLESHRFRPFLYTFRPTQNIKKADDRKNLIRQNEVVSNN
jgi:hypothetical protein